MWFVYIVVTVFSLLGNKALLRDAAIYIWLWNDKAEESFLTEPGTKEAVSLAPSQSHIPCMLS